MDIVRCLCSRDALGALSAVHPKCAIHGPHDPDPIVPWSLSLSDKELLRGMRIGASLEISTVRQEDEGRFNPPRQARRHPEPGSLGPDAGPFHSRWRTERESGSGSTG